MQGLVTSLFFGFGPMFFFAAIVYWLDRYEKEPKLLLGGIFAWGALIAAGGAFLINSLLGRGVYLFTGSEFTAMAATASVIAPVVEECLKGLAVLVVYLIFRRQFDSTMDGIVYASITALGFAATENTYYIYNFGYLQGGMAGVFSIVITRVLLVGWQHPFYTAFIGIGLARSRLARRNHIKILAPLAGLAIAIFFHSMHNTLLRVFGGSGDEAIVISLQWIGWSLIVLFILGTLSQERKFLKYHLKEEVDLGTITPHQYRTACSAWYQIIARLKALTSRQYIATSRFYQVCGRLAHKKRQHFRMGKAEDHHSTIERLRNELAILSPLARA
jgi:protease PrsW